MMIVCARYETSGDVDFIVSVILARMMNESVDAMSVLCLMVVTNQRTEPVGVAAGDSLFVSRPRELAVHLETTSREQTSFYIQRK